MDDVESLRRDIGEKMARDGVDQIGDHSSASAKEGYRRAAMGFGMSGAPRNFGKGRTERVDWTCECGHLNKRYLRNCWVCNAPR